MHLGRTTITLLFSLLLLGTFQSCLQLKSTRILNSYLTANNIKYWDTKVGYSWRFSMADTSFTEYSYNKELNRIQANYGDVLVNNLKWKISKGYLYFGPNGRWDIKYRIVYLSKDKLIVIDRDKSWGKDTLYFTPSFDQSTVPKNSP